MNITTDVSDDTFTTSRLDFQTDANTTQIVIYVRPVSTANPIVVDNNNQVFIDNISLVEDPILSTNDFTINGEDLAAFPVPMTDVLTISGVEVDVATLYSLNGGIVATGAQTVDVAGLSNGAYILEINAEGKKATTMVVK